MTGEEVIQQIASETDTTLLAFSCGKDSLAAWLALRPHFKKIIPIYYYLVPDLGFVEESLRYYEEWFQTRIYRLPHASLYRWLTNYTFQPPEHQTILWAARMRTFSHEEIRDGLAEQLGLPTKWTALGTRAADSPARLMNFRKHGPINHNKNNYCPVWDWKKDRLISTIKEAGVLLPKEYRTFGRSFDGLDFRFLYGIKQHWPEDYQKILQFFPLAELEIKRYEFAQRRSCNGEAQEPTHSQGR